MADNNTIRGAGDVYQKDLYANLEDSAKAALVYLNAINDVLKEQTKNSSKVINIEAKDIKSLNEVTKGIEEVNVAFEQKLKLDKERVKVQKKINDSEKLDAKQLTDIEVKVKKLSAARNELLKREVESDKAKRQGNKQIAEAIKLNQEEQEELKRLTSELLGANIQKQEITKLAKEQVKESQGLVGAYTRESKKLNELRKRYKDLAISEGVAGKEAKDLKREIDKLDAELKDVDASAGQFQRNVGNYPETFGKAAKAITVIIGTLAAAKGAFEGVKTSIDSLEEGAEGIEEATAGLDGALNVVKSTVGAVGLDIIDLTKEALNGNSKAWKVVGNSVLTNLIPALNVLKPELNDTGDFMQRTAKATENFGDKLFGAVDAEREAARRAIEFRKVLRGLETQLAKINGVIAVQNAIAGDSTRSFTEIETAAIKAQKAEQQRANILIKIAKEELSQIQFRLNSRRKLGLEVEGLLDAERDALIKLQETRNDLLVVQLENEKLLRENARDRFERELDFAIDGFDAVKTVNERQITNEQLNLEKRRAIFDETVRLTDKSFANQIKLVQDFTKQKIDLDELSKESDEEVIRQKLKNFNFDDVTLGRILEIIKERKLALQDLTDAQRDLNIVDQDAIDIRKDIIAQEEALGKITEDSVAQSNQALDDLEKDRTNNEIENLRRRLFLAEEGSIEFLNIQKELNDALLNQQKERIDKQVEADQQGADQREAIQKALFDKIQEFVAKRSQQRVADIEEEISATEKQQDRLRELADKGVLGADQSLAAEEKKAAELEREKNEEIRKQELRTAGFKILSALLEQGKSPQEAIPEVGVLLGALPAVIEAIPTFIEGTEDVAKSLGKPQLKGRDGHIIRVDGKERIVDPENNAKMGGISNDEAANIIQGYNKGMLGNLYAYNQPQLDLNNMAWKTNQEIIQKFDSLESSFLKSNNEIRKAIENKPVVTDVTYKKILNQLIITMQENGKTYKTTSNAGKRIS
jgi:hypothetical protein